MSKGMSKVSQMNKGIKTKNYFHDMLDLSKMSYCHYSCCDPSCKDCDKEFEECDHCSPKENKKFGYVQLYYGKNPLIYVTTPVMVCPFGLNKNNFQMSLQFTNMTDDPIMKSFFDFIQELEFEQMKLLGLEEEDEDAYISQIRYDKKGKYDPNLVVKVPFSYNKFNCDIYSDNYSGMSMMNISKFSKLQCDIYLDKVWGANDKYVAKWKVRVIHVL
jgi:hypothetical protein